MGEFMTQMQAKLTALAVNFGMAILVLGGFLILAKVASSIVSRVGQRVGEDRRDVMLLIAQMARIAILVFGVVTALGTLGINVSALVAGLGLTGFALGFAFRDALSNVLAGFMILLYRPFRRGDVITVTLLEGKVTEINLRYTVIQAEGSRVLIPNSNLLTNPIIVKTASGEPPPSLP